MRDSILDRVNREGLSEVVFGQRPEGSEGMSL